MSTQAAHGSAFSITTQPQPLRLLELPPELLDLLSSPNPPRLHFKSSDSKDAVDTAEAVLCTPDKTFFVRQQQTSNGVHIVTPSLPQAQASAISEPGLTAISQCTSSLEIMAAPIEAAKPLLKDLLPLFLEPDDVGRSLPEYYTKAGLFADTPMSDAECQNAWTDLMAFELAPSLHLPKRCFRPSANALLTTWTRLVDIARSEGIDLAGTLRTTTMLEALWNPDEEWPSELRSAIMTRLASTRDILSDRDHAAAALRDGSTLDRPTTVQWLGLLILQARSELQPTSSRLQTDIFLEVWKDALPEAWREDAKLDILPKASYALAADYIRYETNGTDKAGGDAVATSQATNPTKAATGNKRKWHEKFAAARKQGKPA